MPLYEYECLDCSTRFERLRSAADCDKAECVACGGGHTRRLLSRFAALSKGNGGESHMVGGGGGCAGCAGGHCASCGH